MAERIFKVSNKTDNFTILSNEVPRRADLSARAKGIHSYLMTLPKDWKLYREELYRHFTEGRDAINTAFKELEDAGYIKKTQLKENGKFAGWDYSVYETSTVNGFSEYGKPEPGKPYTENPQLLNTNSLPITNELNTEGIQPQKKDATSRIEELRQYWNTKGIKPIKAVMVMNPRDLLPTLSVCDNDMIKKAMDNYYGIGKSPGHDLFPDNYSFEGFLQNGIDRFCDDSDPWEKCKKKEKYHEQTSEERAAILQSLAEQQKEPEPVKEPEHVEPIPDLPTDYEPPRFNTQEIMAGLRKQAGGRT